MPRSVEDILEENNNLLKSVLSRNVPQTGPNTGGGSSSGSGFSFANLIPGVSTFNTAVTNAAGAVFGLWQGSTNAGIALNSMSDAVKSMPVLGGVVSGVTEVFRQGGQAIISTNDNLNQASKSGANFNNNLVQYDQLVKGARLTQEEYNQIVAKNSTALNGLGGNVNQSQREFLNFTRDLQEGDIGRTLRQRGYSEKEIAEYSLVTLANQRNLNLRNASSMQTAMEATEAFATQIDNTTRLTGKSRDAQLDEIKARGENVVVQAAVMRMGEDGMLKYKQIQANMQGLGKSVGDLADEIFTGGVRTKEGSAKMAALGPAGVDLEKAILMQKNAKDPAQKAEAEAAMLKAKAAATDYMRSQAFLDLVQYGVGPQADAARAMMKENVEATALEAKRREEAAKGGPVDTASLLKKSQEEANNARLGRDVLGKPIEEPGFKAATAVNETNIALKDMAAQISAVGFPYLINKVDSTAGGFDNLSTKIRNLDIGKMQEAEKNAGAIIKALDTAGQDIKDKLGIKDIPKATMNTQEALGITTPVINATKLNVGDVPQKATGSFGTVGSFIEDFGKGTLAMLHGKEGVITEDQLKNITTSVAQQGAMMGNQLGDVAKTMTSPNNDMFSGFQNMFSSMTKEMPKDMFSGLKMPSFDISAQINAMGQQMKKIEMPPMPSVPTTPPTVANPATQEATTKDLLDAINTLNKMMGELVSTSKESVNVSEKIARKTSNGNRLLPV